MDNVFVMAGIPSIMQGMLEGTRIFLKGGDVVKSLSIDVFTPESNVAQGIVDALNQIDITQPLVIRLAGTNVNEGIKILKDSKIEYIEAFTLEDAANKAVKALKDLGD